MQNYWPYIFPLSKKLIKDVESVCRRFLWSGDTAASKKAPVAWSTLQLPKCGGGWNIINMFIWNKAAMHKLLWATEFKRDKLWVKWVHSYYIKRQNVLTINLSNQTSWILRKIISTRMVMSDIGGWSQVSTGQKFSMKTAYKILSGDFEKVRWKRLICNNPATPKSKFIMWLTLHNKLATVDRVSKWGVQCDTQCCLCLTELESVQHLFFYCKYVAEVWSGINIQMGNRSGRAQFQNHVGQACKSSRKKSRMIMVMLFTECVYAIWRQRNNKIFRNHCKTPQDVIREILFRVTARCSEEDRHILM